LLPAFFNPCRAWLTERETHMPSSKRRLIPALTENFPPVFPDLSMSGLSFRFMNRYTSFRLFSAAKPDKKRILSEFSICKMVVCVAYYLLYFA